MRALECMERALVLRQHFFGPDSDEVWSACKVVGEMCNLLAMTYLQQENFEMVLELMKKAEILTERDPPGRAVTFNNFACYYRGQGKLHAAYSYLQKALKIEASLPPGTVQNAADTYLNACAVLSQLGRHQTALEHAQQALILLQEELFSPAAEGEPPKAPQADRVAVLTIAYHNIGVELEFLKRHEQSVLSYKKGVQIAEKYLGPRHAITITLKNSLLAATRATGTKKTTKKDKEATTHAATKAEGGSQTPSPSRRSGEKRAFAGSKQSGSERKREASRQEREAVRDGVPSSRADSKPPARAASRSDEHKLGRTM